MNFKKFAFILPVLISFSASSAFSAIPEKNKKDFTDLSLEELLSTTVTSVSKKEQNLFDAASAVYVVSSEDIRRSGAVNVPELLRTVPGVHVAKVTGMLMP